MINPVSLFHLKNKACLCD